MIFNMMFKRAHNWSSKFGIC